MKAVVCWIIGNGENQIACFLEILTILLCLHGIFKEKFQFSISNIFLIVVNLIVMALIYTKNVHKIATGVIYILLFIYCIKKFRRKFWETVGRLMLSLVLVGLIEVFASIVAVPIAYVFEIEEPSMVVVNLVGLLVTLFVLKLLRIKKKKIHLGFNLNTWGTLIAMCTIGLIFIVADYRYRGEVDQTHYFIFLVACIVACIVSIQMQETKHELDKKKLQLELQEIYGDTYKELLAEVRRKQHDFTNQLGAIYSMHVTANSLEELIEKQREYGDVLLEKSRYDKILTGCNNPILAGYLYYKCVAFEKDNVRVDYEIHIDEAKCCLSLHELIEILGILLTNAYENYNADEVDKRIGLVVQEKSSNLMIEVSNIAEELTTKEIEKIFSEGYSSKAQNRGIGLGRVKELVSKAEADLIVENQIKENKNWVNFRILIPKWEGE